MKKLLIICGPTATGKTALAIFLAKKYNGELVSADSKQVYRGLDIGTGKDIPSRGKKKGYYQYQGIKIWGYDTVGPKSKFSVAQYLRFAKGAIAHIEDTGKLPILVGGTGLYIKAVVDGIPTVDIPQNVPLRKSLAEKSPAELFEMLAQLDPIKAGSLNASDRKNPRRLVRAIEIAVWKSPGQKVPEVGSGSRARVLFLALSAPRQEIFKKIDKRVEARVAAGLEEEIRKLLASGVSWKNQSMSSLGYRQWKDYFNLKVEKNEVIKKWKQEEKKYAKRQLTWFRKDKRLNWFDISQANWQKRVEKLVKKWYISRVKE